MNKKDYLDKIVSKITNRQNKIKVLMEIESHLDDNINRYEEIGYDNEIAQEKALELMGDDETVAEQLGAIHNRRQSPAFAIILCVLWLAFLGGAYYLLDKFAFGDIGASSLIMGGFCISLALCFAGSAYALKKNQIALSLGCLVSTISTCVFNYFILNDLNKTMRGNFANLINFSFKHQLVQRDISKNDDTVIATVCITGFLVLIFVAYSIIYYAKTKALSNNRLDNKIRKKAKSISTYFAILMLCIGTMLCCKTVYDINQIYNEFEQAYKTVLDISQKCETKDDVIEYVKNCSLEFKENTNANGDIASYNYKCGIGNILIDFTDSLSTDEVETLEFNTGDESLDQLFMELYELLEKAQIDITEPTTLFSIEFGPSDINFVKSYNSLTLSKKKISDESLSSYNPFNTNTNENFNFLTSITPSKLMFIKTDDKYYDKTYQFTYVVDINSITHYESKKTVSLPTNDSEYYQEESQRIKDIIKSNPDASIQEIEKLTATTAKKQHVPQIIYDIEKLLIDSGYYYGEIKDTYKELLYEIENAYANTYFFYINENIYFQVYNTDYLAIAFYDNDTLIESQFLTPVKLDSFMKWLDDSPLDKCSFSGYYFDRYGKSYDKQEYVIYYDRDGNEFIYYLQKITDNDKTTSDERYHYFTDGNKYYPVDKCFVDENGYFVYDSKNSITFSGDTLAYKDAFGNIYHKAGATSWDADGNKYTRKYTNKEIELWQ